MYSASNFTPSDAKRPSYELMTNINMKLIAKHNRKYPDIKIGNNVKDISKKKLLEEGHRSKLSNEHH